jgi:uncharacterized protein
MEQQNFSQSSETKYASVSGDERTMAILSHVLSIFFWIFPGLIIYLMKKDESPYVAEHAKEALNFQITVAIYCIIGIILSLIIVGIFVLIAVSLLNLVLCIIATIKASDNVLYRYPFTIRLIK